MRIAALLVSCMIAAGQEMPTFRSSSQLVVEVVSVNDRNGQPVEGLRAADLTVKENGVPQAVRLCEFQKLEAPREAAASAGEPAAGIRYRDRRLLALYFDMSAMPVPDQLRALGAARKFVRAQMAPADLVAVMEFSDGVVKVRQDFTDDREKLLGAIETSVAVSQGLEDDDYTGGAFGQDDSEFNIFSTDRQISALQTAVGMLGRSPEKKSLIYFASGLRLRGVDNQAQLRATLNAAIRANVSFFPIDARGLQAGAPLGDATAAPHAGSASYTGAGAAAMAADFQRSQDALYALAADTGGKAMFDYNDLAAGIVQAQRSLTSYYLVGYYATNSAPDGKFRKIDIALKEYPSAKLDYRKGYFAPKEFGKFTAADKERQLEDALVLEDPVTELTIAMEVNYFQLNRAEYYVPVVIRIPGSELALARKGGAERTVLDFVGEIKDEYGTTVQNIRDKVDIKLSGETAAQLAKRPIQYDSGYTLLPGRYTIKVLARDNETGRIGTYLNRFTIPNLNKETQRIAISSVVLGSQEVELRDALYTAGKDKRQAANPLVHEGRKLIPSVTRVFGRTRGMQVYVEAYQPSEPRPLMAFATLYRGQTKVLETAPVKVTEASGKLNAMGVRLRVGLERLRPGRYTVQVSVIDPAGRKGAFWQAPVAVAP